MEVLKASDFFDLKDFAHSPLFNDNDFVWMALQKIGSYLYKQALGKISIKIPEGVYLINQEQISIKEGTVVEPGALIQGPCFIGKNCTIRQGAYIRGNVIAGDECVLGHASEFKNCILLNGSHAAHFAYVGDSILGNRVNLGAGVILANLKLDQGLIALNINGQTIPTNLKKLGAIIGDDSQIGCNSVSNPGTLLGKGVLCYPCTHFGGFIPENKLVKFSKNLIIT